MATRRLLAIDTIRVVAMIAVAAGHLWGGPPGSSNLVRDVVFSWNVPVFFFLTGYLWTPGRTLTYEIRARATTLLLPYASWLVIISIIVTATSTHFPGQLLLSAIRGGATANGPFSAFWFLPALFLVAVIMRALEHAPTITAWAIALAGLITAWNAPELVTYLPLDAGLAFPCLIFVLTGQVLRRTRLPGSRPRQAAAAAATGLVAAALFASHLLAPLDMKYGQFGTPLLSVTASVLICTAIVVFTRAAIPETFTAPSVTEMATVSTVVLLTHLGLFQLLVHLEIPTPATFVLGMSISWLTGIGLHKTAASRFLVGTPRTRTSRPGHLLTAHQGVSP